MGSPVMEETPGKVVVVPGMEEALMEEPSYILPAMDVDEPDMEETPGMVVEETLDRAEQGPGGGMAVQAATAVHATQ